MTTPLNQKDVIARMLPEGCRFTKTIHGSRVRVTHVVKYTDGNSRGRQWEERPGWLLTDVVCENPERVCIQYKETNVILDVPAIDVIIDRIEEI